MTALLTFIQVYCQNLKMDTVIHCNVGKDTVITLYNQCEGMEIVTFKCCRGGYLNKICNTYTVIDGEKQDSSIVVSSLPVLVNNTAFFRNGFNDIRKDYPSTRDVVYINENRNVKKCQSTYYQSNCSLIAFRGDSTRLNLVNPLTNELISIYVFSEKDYKESNCIWGISQSEVEQLAIDNNNTVFFSPDRCLVYISDGDPNGSAYYQLIAEGSTKKYVDASYGPFNIAWVSNNYMMVTKYANEAEIRDCNLNVINKCLGQRGEKIGVDIMKGQMQYYFVKSSLNDADYNARPIKYGTEVIISYKFNPQLEIQMYRAYNDTLLSEADIEGMGKYELGILRNLLFAKHNYAFKSEFYQAYFNMYKFYNSQKMITTRKTNVDNELTANDKANIALIRKMEAKLK